MQITLGQCVLIDDEIVGSLRLLPDGRLQALAFDGLHEVTALAKLTDELKAIAALRRHRDQSRAPKR